VIRFSDYFLVESPLEGVDPEQEREIITRSFERNVISDILATASTSNFDWDDCDTCPTKGVCDAAHKNNLISSSSILEMIKHKIPTLDFSSFVKVDPNVDRVMIKFDDGGGMIHIPTELNSIIGPVIILHEIGHRLYSIDILTKEMVDHEYADAIFTLARTIEDVRIEKLLEQDYPGAKEIFKDRARFIIPLYKDHTPSPFSKIVDSLFLYLRGYSKLFPYDDNLLNIANKFIDAGNNRDKKVKSIIELGEAISGLVIDPVKRGAEPR
jgi:hypothetical protein|tara:strand:- start:6117 stop:6920 length:804 start_codon:yes stop_codon:yes gene_type:complete